MNLKYWLLLSAAASAVGLSSACSSHLDSCQARRTCASSGGVGGKSAGVDAGAAGEPDDTEPGGGGRGSGAGGKASGGSNSESGSAGESGEGGSGDSLPVLFEACSVKGEFACVEQASAQRLACDGQHWQAGTTCAAGQLCNTPTGKCAPIVTECASVQPGSVACREDTVVTCGADLVTASVNQTCAGRCKLGICQLPTCGDEKLESGEVCEPQATDAPGSCVNCRKGTCGDGVVFYANGEQCDDGNLVSGDGCSATCRAEPFELALGDNFTCARSWTGAVKCWGDNSAGQLGLGLDATLAASRGGTPSTVPSKPSKPSKLSAIELGAGQKAVAISAGGRTACALLETGSLKCWGDNRSGQLGTGDTDNRGDGPGEMGDALQAVQLGSGLKAIAVSVGGDHSCALLADGGVKCWGLARKGQLGQGDLTDILSPSKVSPIKLRLPATAISASSYIDYGKGGSWGGATCALLKDGTVQCWGATEAVSHDSSNDVDASYAIGDDPREMAVVPALKFEGNLSVQSIRAGNASAVLLSDGSLRLWGYGPVFDSSPVGSTPAQLASLSATQMGDKVRSVDVQKYRACAVLGGGTLKCWGVDSSGALGLGDVHSTQGAPKDLPSVDLGGRRAVKVATGGNHTCAILDDGKLKCWGSNYNGQLGLGHTDNRGDTGERLSADTTVDLSF